MYHLAPQQVSSPRSFATISRSRSAHTGTLRNFKLLFFRRGCVLVGRGKVCLFPKSPIHTAVPPPFFFSFFPTPALFHAHDGTKRRTGAREDKTGTELPRNEDAKTEPLRYTLSCTSPSLLSIDMKTAVKLRIINTSKRGPMVL